MRRLSLRAVVALSVPAFFPTPAALAQYASYDGGGSEDVPAAIALFSEENYYGDVRDVYDPFATLNDLGFNDRPRSVAVFAGQWELCEHKDFTGRCVFITEDVSDLGWFGLAGRVTSARPIYEYTEAQHGLMFTRDNYGYIRYADNEVYGYDTWSHGYASSWGISVSHYGFSPDYYRYGYYSPTWGYDPYGFAWGPHGTIRYVSTYRRHPRRPSYVNPYWSGWDHRRTDWRHGNWSWRDGHGGGSDWRDHRGGDGRWGDGRGGDGRGGDGRGGDGRGPGRGGDDRPGRDVPGDRWGPGAGGVSPVPTDPRPGRGGDGRDGRGGDGRGGDGRGTGRGGDDRPGRDVPGDRWGPGAGGTSVVTPVPADPRPGRGGRSGWTSGAPNGGVIPAIPADPGRGSRGSDPAGLAGGPSTDGPGRRGGGDGDGWRGRGRGGDDGGRGAGRSGDRGARYTPPAVSSSPPPPPPPQETRREVSRDTAPRDSGKGGFRRRNGDE